MENHCAKKGIKFFVALLAAVLLFCTISFNSSAKAATADASALKTNAIQMIMVEASRTGTSAILQRYVKESGKWKKYSNPMQAVVGKNGIGKGKEGDARTPAGTYLFGTSFGWGNKPAGTVYPFKGVSKYDYWIDDVNSVDYNKWVYFKGDPNQRWQSFERLNHPLYKYAMVIRYNDNPIVKGAGSAIFLHIKSGSTKYTLGCVAVSEGDLISILKWLDSKKKPVIEIKHVEMPQEPVKITANTLNIRSGASINYKIVGNVTKNKSFSVKDVVLNSQNQLWLRIEYTKGKYGWISAMYTTYKR